MAGRSRGAGRTAVFIGCGKVRDRVSRPLRHSSPRAGEEPFLLPPAADARFSGVMSASGSFAANGVRGGAERVPKNTASQADGVVRGIKKKRVCSVRAPNAGGTCSCRVEPTGR